LLTGTWGLEPHRAKFKRGPMNLAPGVPAFPGISWVRKLEGRAGGGGGRGQKQTARGAVLQLIIHEGAAPV